MPSGPGRPVSTLFLDIDGTVRLGLDELGHWVNGPKDVQVFPGVPDLLAAAKQAGRRVIGISNQGGIALGHTTVEQAQAAMDETNRQCRGVFDAMIMCPHHPEAPDPDMRACWCRKPRIGMLIMASMQLWRLYDERVLPDRGVLVGDRSEDEACAVAAGLRFVWARDWRGT